MELASLSHLLAALLALGLLYAAYTDWRRRQIDNWLNAVIALAAPLFWFACGLGLADIGWQFALALGSFVLLAGLFAMGAMGGGDVKLLTALALWIKPMLFLQLVTIMAVAGGVLTIGFAFWHIARRNRHRIAIPYGLAIAFGGLWVLAANYLPFAAGHPLG